MGKKSQNVPPAWKKKGFSDQEAIPFQGQESDVVIL
jgi:hypothetical protein